MSSTASEGSTFMNFTPAPIRGGTLILHCIKPISSGSSSVTEWKEGSCRLRSERELTAGAHARLQRAAPVLARFFGCPGRITYCGSESDMQQQIRAFKAAYDQEQTTSFNDTQRRFKDTVHELISVMNRSNRQEILELAALAKLMTETFFARDSGEGMAEGETGLMTENVSASEMRVGKVDEHEGVLGTGELPRQETLELEELAKLMEAAFFPSRSEEELAEGKAGLMAENVSASETGDGKVDEHESVSETGESDRQETLELEALLELMKK